MKYSPTEAARLVEEALDCADNDVYFAATRIRFHALATQLRLAGERIAELERDARRYWRLRVLGCDPYYLARQRGGMLRFQNLDDAIDEDIARQPSRGEAELRALASTARKSE